MASQNAANSTELRNAIQQADPLDIISLTSGTGTTYSVTTLAKLVCNTPGAVEGSGYVIRGTAAGVKIQNTRIFQNNIDGPYAPGQINMSTGRMTLDYTTGGAADGSSLFNSNSGTFSFDSINFTGTHRGWDGNGGLYMDMRAFGNNTANTTLTLSNSSVAITGQGQGTNYSFNPTSTSASANGSAFIHSWNNTGTVTLNSVTFDESGFLSSFNFGNDSETPKGQYIISNSIFKRDTEASQVVRYEGNRFTNAKATLTDNTFQDGSYLDLYGNVSEITFAGTNTFSPPANGYGIRVTALAGVTTGDPVLAAESGLAFTGDGMALSYITLKDANNNFLPGTVKLDTNGGNQGSISVNGTGYQEAIAGGGGADAITATGSNNGIWVNADAGEDTVTGSTGNDLIYGGAGNDSINAGNGSDVIFAGDDDDTVFGGAGTDTIDGGSGNDRLEGGGLGDSIDGGVGNDTLIGGTASDVLTGGAGSDVFRWNSGDGSDTITDFSTTDDKFSFPDIFDNTSSGQTLNSGEFYSVSTLSAMSVSNNKSVVKITSNQLNNAIQNTGYVAINAYVLVSNSNSSNLAQLWYDADWSDSNNRTRLATFNGVTSTADFANTNFLVN
jgi:Ca2+-binding RTX toxin-like protein